MPIAVTNPALYNLTPLAPMLLAGLVLALVPVAWVAWRHRRGTPVSRVHALTLLTLFLTFDLVLFGAFTRLTDSGLGCPDWPGCYGTVSPLGAAASIEAAQTALPDGPVTQRKAWIEMIHRYLATGVGALILLVAVLGWKRVPANRAWALATLVWVCVQGAFGALTVTMKLFPAIVTLHLLGGLLLLALLTVQVVRHADLPLRPVALGGVGSTLLWLGIGALAVQVALGGWVSTNYAVLACSDFPRCQGSFWPPMDFAQGFEVWRPLGLSGQIGPAGGSEHVSFAALTAIHFTHRAWALVVVALLGALAWRLNRHPPLRIASRWLAGLLGLQVATGLANVVLGWPLLAAVLHTGGAAALVVVLTAVVCATRVATAQTRASSSSWGAAA